MSRLSPIERAIEYIEGHLHENIGLDDVSREVGYSYYHMTRLFSSVLGESVGRYINRRRLYNASGELLHSSRRILDIALESGFESPEAFCRAFKAAFGSSPIEYRKAGLDLVVSAKKQLASEDVAHIANNISRTPEILVLKETRVAGIRGTASLFNNQLPQLWEQFLHRYKKIYDTAGIGYSICETRRTAYNEEGDVSFGVLAGCPVGENDSIPEALTEKTLSAGRYAVFTHRGTLANLFKTYQYIYGIWLTAAKEELDDREDFEVYEHAVLSLDDPDNEVKIYIPVK
ncbi:AraC family transcriptional regulator [Anaerolentibacter hominis]|uniref:AraC family transcriptional regulator n=1 Tax=Anaerolentibacter hominis TaxID=3079009 RepID=UPI0031B87E4F